MQGKNKVLFRYLDKEIATVIKKKQSCLILGPRQVGKTTLVDFCLRKEKNVLRFPLQNPSVRIDLESDPGLLIKTIEAEKIKPIVFIDEAQKIPEIFDAVQYLIDNKKAQFILTGSSARKLRKAGVNLLPGRVRHFYLDPFLWGEAGLIKENYIDSFKIKNVNKNKIYSFEEALIYGSLPRIITEPESERKSLLRSYSEIYLEEEIRAEALSRKIGAFSRFLELAALESGTSPNFSKLSWQSGVSQPAIKEFYNILEDTLVAKRVDPFLKNARKRIMSSSRYYFFDLGVRNALARLPLEKKMINAQKGILFEHAVMLEIVRRTRALNKNYKINYWRTRAGAEVDCVIDMGAKVIPIEIKASKNISLSKIKGLKSFLNDYKNIAGHGYVITMGERKEKIADNITAIPWFCL
ncbi:ATP-binding protein [Candidatus Parcubacteria bacterium]|nr:ATP-binding protein [Candidatus Parcubacteria bacterium]